MENNTKMTYEQLADIVMENETRIRDSHRAIKEAQEQFIEDNKKFSIGEKIVFYGQEGFVSNIEIRFGRIEYKLHKVKKDGTMSRFILAYSATDNQIKSYEKD